MTEEKEPIATETPLEGVQKFASKMAKLFKEIEDCESEVVKLVSKIGNPQAVAHNRNGWKSLKVTHEHFNRGCSALGLNEGGK